MKRRNLRSSLPRRRAEDPMRSYDALPAELRRWLAEARLPWSPRSVRRLWARVRAEGGDAAAVLARAEAASLARDAPRVWGAGYPGAPSPRS